MTAEVAAAIKEIRESFPKAKATVLEDADGGALVTVNAVDLGSPYVQKKTWVKFHITFQYPYSDVYPHFVRPDLARIDEKPLGEGMSSVTFGDNNEPAIQISRRSNKLNPATDTAALKLVKVLKWLRTQ